MMVVHYPQYFLITIVKPPWEVRYATITRHQGLHGVSQVKFQG